MDVNRLPNMVGQFLLARAESPQLAAWRKQQQGQWILHWHPNLDVREIRSQAGAQVGWIMGLAVDSEGRSLPPVWQLPFDCDGVDAGTHFESELNQLGGRFAAVFLTPQSQRFYLDATGSLAAVHCEDRQAIASSCNLIPQIEDLERNQELIRAIGIPSRDGYIPFGLTPWFRVSRLLPNHFLDLVTWTAVRHWPKNDLSGASEHPEKTVEQIAALIEAFIAGAAKQAPLQIPLTAGYDSRMLLACCRVSLSRIRFYTTAIPDPSARTDCAYGRRMARKFGLEYSVMSWRDPSDEEVEGWLYRTGYSVVDRITRSVKTDQQCDPERITLLGLGGEVGRGYLWRPDDRQDHPLAAHDLLQRFNFPAVDLLVREASDWLDTLPTENLLERLDLFYLEQRLGCWAGPSMYGPPGSRFVAYPFNSRQIYELMLSLPVEYRRQQRLPADLIRCRWPELLEFPFNEPVGLLRLQRNARHFLAIARKAVRNSLRLAE